MNTEAFVDDAIRRVCRLNGITVVQFYRGKTPPIVRARETIYRLLFNTIRADGTVAVDGLGDRQASYPMLGRLMGGFNHATLILMERRILARMNGQGFPLLTYEAFLTATGGT